MFSSSKSREWRTSRCGPWPWNRRVRGPKARSLRRMQETGRGPSRATLDGDPVADVIRALAPWSGTATALLAELNNRSPENVTKRKDWFSRPRQLSDALRRLAPALRRVGVDVTFKKSGTRRIEIQRMSAPTASTSSRGPDSLVDPADAQTDAAVDSSAGSSADQSSVIEGLGAVDAVGAYLSDGASDAVTKADDGDLRSYQARVRDDEVRIAGQRPPPSSYCGGSKTPAWW